jgi:hypothetical protein
MSVALALCGAAPASAGELLDTVPTVQSRAALSAFLVHPAEQAAAKRSFGKAIALYQALATARGPASPEARKLATLWTLAGQNEDAARVLEAFAAATTDAAAATEAKAEAARLLANPDPYAKRLELPVLAAEAKRAFKQGRAAFAKQQWGDALVSFHMGYALAPDLPGFLRELGATYEKLDSADKKLAFYRAYLQRRPFGKNADVVRAELGKTAGALGALTLSSSLPCDQVWVNAQRVPDKMPAKPIAVAPGSYKAMCLSQKYEMAIFEYATVTAGQTSELRFDWAIVVNALENPLGRIVIENYQNPSMMIDLGVSTPEYGVGVPHDGRALKLVVKDETGTRTEERSVRIRPGERYVVKW